jgi:PII-like signaling protein
MEGSFLRVYMHEGERHHGQLAWEWLLEEANALGIRGGSAFKAMAGFGRHHKLNEAKFFELAGSLAVEVEFIVTDQEAQQLLTLIHREKMPLFYTHMAARFGVVDLQNADPPSIDTSL